MSMKSTISHMLRTKLHFHWPFRIFMGMDSPSMSFCTGFGLELAPDPTLGQAQDQTRGSIHASDSDRSWL